MHAGQLKDAVVNRYFADKYAGRFLVRLDDLWPLSEEGGFEDAILHDLKLLGIGVDRVARASNHLAALIAYARRLIEVGDAYMDDTPLEKVSMDRTKYAYTRLKSSNLSWRPASVAASVPTPASSGLRRCSLARRREGVGSYERASTTRPSRLRCVIRSSSSAWSRHSAPSSGFFVDFA